MWRTTHDIMPKWFSIYLIYNHTIRLYKNASPGHVNDPDMLEVGNGKLTIEENRAHFTLWCMMAAPLILGNDLRELQNGSKKSDAILKIVTNENLIRVDQDSLVKPAKRIARKGTIDISRIGKAQIKNLWSEEIFHSDTIKTSVASHDVKVFRISNL